ncbi:uncharacterized protein BKA55DRAFT_543185 [Fusarium redolens]|uniref:Uncharacterized protein n=1 Tax=Fusarium redolens TaxID=48865 RepID=A0A9P9GDQ4_FUSRE|nr:uncharacterized protein BKA55DRAFT_543185 [Fusarium redolens]KAH7237664.1 hypothetical protein BKA55DRAFT_543185 [Fusarium redolens]
MFVLGVNFPDYDSDVLGNMILAMNIHVPHSHPLSPGSSVHSFDTDSDSNSSAGTELSHSFSGSTTKREAASSQQSPLQWNKCTHTSPRIAGLLPTPLSSFSWDCSGPLLGTGRKLARVILMMTNVDDGSRADLQWLFDSARKASLANSTCSTIPTQKPELKKFEDDLVGERKSRKNKKKTTEPGVFLKSYNPGHPHPKSDSSFWIAKIANSIQELGSYERKFEFDVVSSNKFHIVNAKIWNYGLDGPTLIPVREPEEIDS